MGKYRRKSRSCGLCKPHKRGLEDKRSVAVRRRDEADRRDRSCE